ncbi:MAG: hypothetical protein B7X52_04920 [Thiotrichales bacterium 34-46-19]|nr:MAG: hypothetical protein B7X85_00060 [Thiotrichales bacterium 17-46-47]OZA96571.1 MAG: hypothetical protein B7X52_04920 [Thiotrichales bacterium 34-46-19]HQT01970.1 hypothetical protein [Thiotrichales bacterium]HQT04088.1 hypothetical protein [Thiotrichales bacterium]
MGNAERFTVGGHHVPDEDVIRRFTRARENFWYHYRMLASQWSLYSNTGDAFDSIAVGEGEDSVLIQPQLFDVFVAGVTKNANNQT